MCDQKEEEELKYHQEFKEEEKKEVVEENQEEEEQEVEEVEQQVEEEEVEEVDDDYSSISLFQIIIIAVALFLATNGPTNYPLLWNQLTNPPADSRHAIRNGNSGTIPVSPHTVLIPIQTIQMREYALGVQQSLETNVANAENRIALVNRMFGDLALDDKKSGEMAELLVGMNMTNVKNYFLQLQDFSLKNFRNEVGGKELHEKIMERWIKFVDNIIHIHKQL
ncbi:unnamed protein product [Meloidogyne enterolobii]|uniref:Uncharacterized protein n=3 Tax=Meloidogyne enterolobii TaxID=390850 RepID=A0ACB1B552_MELEN